MLKALEKLDDWKRQQLYVQIASLRWYSWLALAGVFALLVIPALRRPILSWLIFPEQE